MNGFDALATAYPTVTDWEEVSPGRWRGTGGLTGMRVLALVAGKKYMTMWPNGAFNASMEAQLWERLQRRVSKASR